ncbi:MAG: PEP-CTERM sorting domain-containing protein [Thiobacillaceae bacterium]
MPNNVRRAHVILRSYRNHLAALALAFVATPALAGYEVGGPCTQGGNILESSLTPANFVVHLSKPDGSEFVGFLPGAGPNGTGATFPLSLTGSQGADGNYHAQVYVPCLPGWDAHNDTIITVPGGGPGNPGSGVITSSADLLIESWIINAQGQYQLLPIFDTIAMRGFASMTIPDLYATDANGNLIDGVELYSLVDLNTFDNAPFSLGDQYSITDGVDPALPDMWFSTTPFNSFDPTTGFFDAFTPYTGTAIAISNHTGTVPEPISIALVGLGLLGIAVTRLKPRQHS